MAVFEYQAIDLDRSALGGTIVADTPRQARDQLRDRGLTVTEIREAVRGLGSGFWERRRGRAAQGEVAAFIRELATLLGAGIPLLGTIETLTKQRRGRMKTVIQQLADQVRRRHQPGQGHGPLEELF